MASGDGGVPVRPPQAFVIFDFFPKPKPPEPGSDGWLTAYRWGATDASRVRLDRVTQRDVSNYTARGRGFALVVRADGETFYVRPEDVPRRWCDK